MNAWKIAYCIYGFPYQKSEPQKSLGKFAPGFRFRLLKASTSLAPGSAVGLPGLHLQDTNLGVHPNAAETRKQQIFAGPKVGGWKVERSEPGWTWNPEVCSIFFLGGKWDM